MSGHLSRRGGIWWARLSVPARLRGAAGRREFNQSCRTHELAVAKLVCAVFLADWRLQIFQLDSREMSTDVLKIVGGSPVLAGGGSVSLADAVRESGIGQSQLLRTVADGAITLFCRLSWVKGVIMPMGELGLQPAMRTPAGKVVIRNHEPSIPERQDMPECVYDDSVNGIQRVFMSREVADELLANELKNVSIRLFYHDNSHVFVANDAVVVEVGRLEVLAADVEAIRQRLAHSVPPGAVERAQALQMAALQGSASSAGKKAHKRFSEAVEEYVKDPSGLPHDLTSESERHQRKKGILLFAEFMGDMPLGEIDSDKLRSFRDGPLRTFPAKANNLPKELKRKSMRETIDAIAASGVEWPLMSLSMRRERMLWISRLFAWLKAKEWLKEDLFAALHGESGLTKSERRELGRVNVLDDDGRGPFSDDELIAIFGQPHFASGEGKHVKKPGYWYPFQFWLPLLGLFAGCRIKEASQLHVGDVRQGDGGIWCLDINENTRDKSLKNFQSKRLIPINQKLIDIGFLDYCERLRSEGFMRVFPELTWSKSDAKYAKESGRKMSDMLKKLGMPRDSMHVFHCLRHNMNNALARVPLANLPFADEGLKKFIRYTVMGHKPGDDVNAIHYTHTTPSEMAALIRGLAYKLPEIAKFDIDFGIGQIHIALRNKEGFRRGREDMGPLSGD